MTVKSIAKRIYAKYLKMRFHMRSGGAMLATEFYHDYKRYPPLKTFRIHRRGFTVSNWLVCNINEDNYKEYLTDADYFGMHPINGQFSAWIDDKLTLKYLCTGTVLDKYMPAYYFQIDAKGHILPLMDYDTDKTEVKAEDVAELLREKTELAVKLIAGSIGEGFYKAEYKNGEYLLNGKVFTETGFCEKLRTLRNYLIIEYLHTHDELARFSPDTVNSIRYLLGRLDGKMITLARNIRFGTKASGYVENYGTGGIACFLDENGCFTQGNVCDRETGKNKIIMHHPDNGVELTGQIPLWSEILKACRELDRFFPQLDYLGIDFVVTQKNQVKILEINSLSSIEGIQLYGSILNTPNGKFFKERMQ